MISCGCVTFLCSFAQTLCVKTPLAQRLAEIEEAVKYGATEIDIGNSLIVFFVF
jgi:hypothetical protein